MSDYGKTAAAYVPGSTRASAFSTGRLMLVEAENSGRVIFAKLHADSQREKHMAPLMKQAILTGHGFEIRDLPKPSCDRTTVLVRTMAIGICGGDVGIYKNTAGRGAKELALGHEASGEVIDVGADVKSLRIGDLVTALGGKFAEYNTFDPADLVRLPPAVNPLWALGEPVACCVHAMSRSKIKAGDRVAIVGCGFMGLICLQLARERNAQEITAIDTVPTRLAMAKRLGARQVQNANELSIDRLHAEGRDFSGEYDVVIEAAGNQAALDLCGYLVKQHGLINLVGHHFSNEGRRTVYMNQWNVKAIDVVNGHVRRNDEKYAAMEQGVQLAAGGRLMIEPLVTCYPLSKIEEAVQQCLTGQNNLIKAVITPGEQGGG